MFEKTLEEKLENQVNSLKMFINFIIILVLC